MSRNVRAEYISQLFHRAFSDTWKLVFDRSFWSAMIAIGIFFGTFWYLRYRKQHEEAKRALKAFGIATLVTGCAFPVVFFLHVLLFTPAALFKEEHNARTTAEKALKNKPPALMQFQVTETDREARQRLKDTQKQVTELKGQLTKANETIERLKPIRRSLSRDQREKLATAIICTDNS